MNSPNGVACRPIEGFPGYYIDADGAPWSARIKGRRRGVWRPEHEWVRLSVYRRPYGARYSVVCFRPDPGGRVVQRYVHRLVLEAFVGPCPPGMLCCHNDGDSANNRLGNLRWDTPAANAADTLRHGRRPKRERKPKPPGPGVPRGERHPFAKLTEDAVRFIRREVAGGTTRKAMARLFRVSPSLVGNVVRKQIWAHVTDG